MRMKVRLLIPDKTFLKAMNLREEILKEHSKAKCNEIVAWVNNSQKRFDELLFLFLKDEDKIKQRAAWPLSYCVEAHPELANKHFDKLIKNLEKTPLHDAVKRNTIRLLRYTNIPEKYHGPLMNICFEYAASPKEPIAVKVFSLNLLEKLAKIYPEIIPEIKWVIDDQIENQSAGFKSCAKHMLKNLKTI